ncbi:hypothetical protein LDENG_00185000 [Lucifuga dentata]|nr:hypothetical protein LDENG_00185000 [Lucifuga dentata]
MQLQRRTTDKASYQFKPQQGKTFRISTRPEKISDRAWLSSEETMQHSQEMEDCGMTARTARVPAAPFDGPAQRHFYRKLSHKLCTHDQT